MNEIANIINQLETQKTAIEQALEALRDFGETGSITPGKSAGKAAPARRRGMTPEGRRRLAIAMKRLLGGETHRDAGKEGSNKENWPDCGRSAEIGRIHEAALGRKTDRCSGKQKSGLNNPEPLSRTAQHTIGRVPFFWSGLPRNRAG